MYDSSVDVQWALGKQIKHNQPQSLLLCNIHVCSELQNKIPFLIYIQHLCADALYMEAL